MATSVCTSVASELLNANSKDNYRRIWAAVASIPPGRVASYGQIAELAGQSRGARLVGHALRAAPRDADLPWHRVLNAQGRISIPRTEPACQEQARRLHTESVQVIEGRVDMARYRWEPGLDELVWGPASFRFYE